MAEKVTWMVLKVDLQCSSCYMKVKKILCKFPQIRDQAYDKQKNLVRITVVCRSPEKIRDKLCCKGGKVIQSIEILEPPKPPKKPEVKITKPEKPPTPAADPPKICDPTPAPEPQTPPKSAPPPAESYPVPVGFCCRECYHGHGRPVQCYLVPVGFCCRQCYDGYVGGPCYHGHGRPAPPPPPPCYDNYYYCYGKGCFVSRCAYFSEENTPGCRIM